MLLRVKQAGNPLFGFLLPADPLYAFYRWLVETRPEDRVVINAAPVAADGSELRVAPAQQAAREQQRQQHPSEQWRVGPAEQPPPWREPQQAPAEAAAVSVPHAAAVQHGPALRPPDAQDSLSLLSQYDDDWGAHGRAAPAAQPAEPVPSAGHTCEAAAPAAPQDQQQPKAGPAIQPAVESASTAAAASAAASAAAGPKQTESAPSDDDQPTPEMLAVMQKLVAFIKVRRGLLVRI